MEEAEHGVNIGLIDGHPLSLFIRVAERLLGLWLGISIQEEILDGSHKRQTGHCNL